MTHLTCQHLPTRLPFPNPRCEAAHPRPRAVECQQQAEHLPPRCLVDRVPHTATVPGCHTDTRQSPGAHPSVMAAT